MTGETTYTTWRDLAPRGQTQLQARYVALALATIRARTFQAAVVPGPLQTAAYARRVLTLTAEQRDAAIDDLDEAVAVRMSRARLLGVRVTEFLIAESVLQTGWCPRQVMREQLDHLNAIARAGGLRVLPGAAEVPAIPQHSFTIWDRHLVTLETGLGELAHHGADEVQAYERLWEQLWSGGEERAAASALIGSARSLT